MTFKEFEKTFRNGDNLKGQTGDIVVALINHLQLPWWRRWLMGKEYQRVLNGMIAMLNITRITLTGFFETEEKIDD